jgi:phage terminase small subunit
VADKLNSRQKRFVAEFAADANGKQSAIRAGYSARTAEVQASRLLRNVKVSRELSRQQEKIAAKLELTAERVLAMLEEARDVAMAAEPPQTSAAIKATELLGKHIGMFPNRVAVTGDGGGPIKVETKTDPTPGQIDAILAKHGYTKAPKE